MGAPDPERRRLAALNKRAAAYCADGRYETALPLFEQVVAGCTARLGSDDPDTLISQGNLVVTQLRVDPCGPALRGLDANVAARRRVLGARHPATLAACAAQSTAYELAAVAMEQDLWEHMAAFGPEHPETVALRTDLAQLRVTRPPPPQRTSPEADAGAVPPPRHPRGARFPRVPEQAADGAHDHTVEGPTRTGRRPRRTRFARWGW